jgi:hypothetical protein
MSDIDDYQAKADEYARLLSEATTPEARESLVRMEQSYRLLARHAEWLRSTANFIKELRDRPLRPAPGQRGAFGGFARPPLGKVERKAG